MNRFAYDNAGNNLYSSGKLKQKLIAACLLGFVSAAQGAENEPADQQNPNLPSLEFLEFLGQFETDSGQWIEPGSLLTEEFGNLLDASITPAPNSDANDDSPANGEPNSANFDQQSNN